MENVKWLIQKKGVFIIELLVIVIACVIVLKGPKIWILRIFNFIKASRLIFICPILRIKNRFWLQCAAVYVDISLNDVLKFILQYVSNRIIPSEENQEGTWHKPRYIIGLQFIHPVQESKCTDQAIRIHLEDCEHGLFLIQIIGVKCVEPASALEQVPYQTSAGN